MVPQRRDRPTPSLEGWRRDLCLARKVQCALQNASPPAVPGVTVAGASLPAQVLSGDYYDFLLLDGKIRLLIADVMGKGASAALQMAMARMAARLASLTPAEPEEFLAELNETLYPDLRRLGSFLTMFCADYHLDSRTLTCANAGHPFPLLRRARTPRVAAIPARGIAIGAIPRARYQTVTVDLGPGDTVLFFTDGATAVTDPAGGHLPQRLAALFLAHRRPQAAGLRDRLVAELQAFTGGPPQRDDITLALLQVQQLRPAGHRQPVAPRPAVSP